MNSLEKRPGEATILLILALGRSETTEAALLIAGFLSTMFMFVAAVNVMKSQSR